MNNLQLTDIMLNHVDDSVQRAFRGVITMDVFVSQITSLLDASSINIFILNTKRSTDQDIDTARGHWLLVMVQPWRSGREEGYDVIYFDSYAKPSRLYGSDFSTVLQALTAGPIQISPYRIQSDESRLCGLYCIYVATNLHRYNFKLSHLIRDIFIRMPLEDNDKLLFKWMTTQPFSHLFDPNCTSEGSMCIKYSELFGNNGYE